MLALHGQIQGNPKVNPKSGGQKCPPYMVKVKSQPSKFRCHMSFLLPDSGDNLCGAVTLFVQLLDAKIVFDGA